MSMFEYLNLRRKIDNISEALGRDLQPISNMANMGAHMSAANDLLSFGLDGEFRYLSSDNMISLVRDTELGTSRNPIIVKMLSQIMGEKEILYHYYNRLFNTDCFDKNNCDSFDLFCGSNNKINNLIDNISRKDMDWFMTLDNKFIAKKIADSRSTTSIRNSKHSNYTVYEPSKFGEFPDGKRVIVKSIGFAANNGAPDISSDFRAKSWAFFINKDISAVTSEVSSGSFDSWVKNLMLYRYLDFSEKQDTMLDTWYKYWDTCSNSEFNFNIEIVFDIVILNK